MANNLKDLDAEQVLRSVYDPDTNTLRVVSNITSVVTGEQEVEIKSSEDSVAIGNTAGTNFAAISAAGAIRVDPTLDDGATATNQVAELGALVSIDGKVSTEAKQDVGNTSLASIDDKSTRKFATASNTRPIVTTTSSIILSSNSNRMYALIFNQTGGVVFLKLGATAVTNQGIRLADNDYYEITSNNLFTGDIYAIKLAGSAAIEVFEGTP